MTKQNKGKTMLPNRECSGDCNRMLLAVRDALAVLNGKWKIPILVSLMHGTKRFRQISKDLDGITDRMLSKELKELEENELITRTVYDAFPPVVEYEITAHGVSLGRTIRELKNWGETHRARIMRNQVNAL